MTNVVQGMVGAAACVVTFAAGIFVGHASARDSAETNSTTAPIQVVLPDRLRVEHSGIPSDREACLKWVSKNFEHPNVGQLAMICAGAKL